MKFVKLTRKNLHTALKIFDRCFLSNIDRKEARYNFNTVLDGSCKMECKSKVYYIVYLGKDPVGITGHYQIKDGEFWQAWFCVVPERRRQGVGSEIMCRNMAMAQRRGCKVFRAWGTSKRAGLFYRKNGLRMGRKIRYEIYNGRKVYTHPRGSVFYYKVLNNQCSETRE